MVILTEPFFLFMIAGVVASALWALWSGYLRWRESRWWIVIDRMRDELRLRRHAKSLGIEIDEAETALLLSEWKRMRREHPNYLRIFHRHHLGLDDEDKEFDEGEANSENAT